MTRLPRPPSVAEATRPLQKVHADLAGPFTPVGLHGHRYYLLVIDTYSRFNVLTPIKHKSDAADALLDSLNQLESLKGQNWQK
jgi:transposase InsO family protein